jgi:endonuclease/exonuclease/phosphatase family metal-dependent hydrolase
MNASRSSQFASQTLRVATYNIHKGVRGVGPRKRLEIHNLGLGIEALDADLVFLQEVRRFHHREARRFQRTSFGWPDSPRPISSPPRATGRLPDNAVTRRAGAARCCRAADRRGGHHDVGPPLRAARVAARAGNGNSRGARVVPPGLMHAGRVRQVQRLAEFIAAAVPSDAPLIVAGDFNDWGERLDAPMRDIGLVRALGEGVRSARRSTFPSRVPVFALDRIYTRALVCRSSFVPRGASWARMSDHLPLVAEFEWP